MPQIKYEVLHNEIHEKLLCPLTGITEPMRLEVSRVRRSNFLIYSTDRKPSGRFYQIATGNEIPYVNWTREMVSVYDTAVKGNTPVPNRSSGLTLMGKVVAILALVGVLALAISIYRITGNSVPSFTDSLPMADSITVVQ